MEELFGFVCTIIFFLVFGLFFYKIILPKIDNRTKNKTLLYFSYYTCFVILEMNLIAKILTQINLDNEILIYLCFGILLNVYYLIIFIPFFVILWIYNVIKWYNNRG